MEIKSYGFVADESTGDVSDRTVISHKCTLVYLVVAALSRASVQEVTLS